MAGNAVARTTEQCELGEGVRWDARRDELLRVDILSGRIYRDKIIDDGGLLPVETYHVAGTVAAIAPIQGDEGWLLAAARGFSYLRPDGTVRPVAEVAPEGTRMNDAACDPQGRFWAGTLAHDQRAGGGSLYRLDNTGQTELIMSGLTISNGLGWSPDGSLFYSIDTTPGLVYVRDRGGERRVLLDLDVSPDGMCVDAAGNLWIAVYGAGEVRRYTPSGELTGVVSVPEPEATCPAFVGPGLDRLLITTRPRLFLADVGAVGLPVTPWAGFD